MKISKKEKRFLYEIESELSREQQTPPPLVKDGIKTKADAYFFLKNYCIENLVLLNQEQREFFLKKIEKFCGVAR